MLDPSFKACESSTPSCVAGTSRPALTRAKEELRTLERKLVVLLEEQQRELDNIRRRQEKKGMLLLTSSGGSGADGGGGGPGGMIGGGGGDGGGPSAKDKRQAAQLMQSTETLMKFGFMSMSMTYFSSLNMIRAMRSVGATDTVMAALAHNANGAGAGGGGGGGGGDGRALALEQNEKLGAEPFRPALKPGQLPGQEPLAVAAWSVDDVARWLQARWMGLLTWVCFYGGQLLDLWQSFPSLGSIESPQTIVKNISGLCERHFPTGLCSATVFYVQVVLWVSSLS